MARRSSRKHRRAGARRSHGAARNGRRELARTGHGRQPGTGGASPARPYARSRAKDEAARAALEPLAEGERPRAVAVAAIAAVGLAAANLVALVVGYDPNESGKTVGSAVAVVGLGLVAWGMWRARYWAVLGMQTLLAIAIVAAAVALITARNAAAVLGLLAIVVPAGTLFWFLVKAMARIQMPDRP